MGLTVLDAPLVIAILDSEDAHHESAIAALARRLEARDAFVMPVSAYAEVLVGPFRRGEEAVATVEAFLETLPAPVHPATREIGRRAAALRADIGRRIRLPDALVLATALELSADRVLTTDRDWPPVGVSIEVV